jgi:alpha-1,2-glucosyltransferase
MPNLLQTSALPAAVLFIVNLSTTWYNAVSKDVPEPYLASTHKLSTHDIELMKNQDEFFHVPQAQLYCKGDYTWDPKITTPPGL